MEVGCDGAWCTLVSRVCGMVMSSRLTDVCMLRRVFCEGCLFCEWCYWMVNLLSVLVLMIGAVNGLCISLDCIVV